MSINRTFSNREPRQNLRGVYREYETRTCETCGKEINSPKGKEYPCVYCKYLGNKAGKQIVAVSVRLPKASKYIVSRSWIEQHLNSDDDLKHFPGTVEVRG